MPAPPNIKKFMEKKMNLLPLVSKLENLNFKSPLLIASLSLLTLAGCGSSSSGSSSSSEGYINLYNVSANSPEIFLTVDEDLEKDEEDEVEITYPGVAYTDSSGIYELDDQEYFYELGWQDEDDDDRDDLTLIFQDKVKIEKEKISFLVVSEDISNPSVINYSIDIVDDEDDDVDDLFNLRVLNMHTKSEGLDVYMSESDETFNEAVLVGSYAYQELSDNKKFDQDEYVFYVTAAGADEVLYESQEISFPYSSQYVISVRPYKGTDETTFVIDKISLSSITSYPDANADASYKVYNAILPHDLIPTYAGSIDFYLDNKDETPEYADVALHTDTVESNVARSDYSVSVTVAGTDDKLLHNHLLSLPENSDKSIFFYLDEEEIDDEDDDKDGEIEITIKSLVVDNSTDESIYDHQIKMINLVDDEDFSAVTFYYVRNNELVDTTPYYRTTSYARASEIDLVNNTYQVYAIATEDSSEVILGIEELVLDEDSKELFLILEEDMTSPSGYRMTFKNQ